MLFIACFSTRVNKAWLPLCDVAWNWNNRAMLFMEQDHVIVILQLFLVLRRCKEQGLACLCLCIGDPGPSPTELSTQDSWQNKAWLAFASVLGIQVPHLLNFQHRTPDRTRPGLPLPLCWGSRSLTYWTFNTGLLTEQGLACLCLCVGDPGPLPISTQDSWQNKAWLPLNQIFQCWDLKQKGRIRTDHLVKAVHS